MRRLFLLLSGGRPMRHLGFAFFDVVSGDAVHYFADTFGRVWMAKGRWSWFRVATGIVDD